MKKKNALYILIAIILTLALATGVTFAIFTAENKNNIGNITPGGSGDEIIINSQYELIINSVSSEYNSDSLVSNTRSRLKLGKNIKLDKAIVIDKDISLSLGGFNLDNGGYDITIRHNYAGLVTVRLDSGKLEGGGKLVLDTPRSVLDTDIANELIRVLSFDRPRIIEEAKEYITKWLKPYYVVDFTLPLYYRFYTEIGYFYQFLDKASSEVSTIVDSLGRINWDNVTDTGSAELLLKVTIADDPIGLEYSTSIVKSNSKKLAIAQEELIKELAKYKIGDRYIIKGNVGLPKRYDYLDVDFAYEVSNATIVSLNNGNILNVLKSGYFELTATLGSGSETQNVVLKFTCQLNSAEEIASKFVKDYFQWIFVYNNDVVEITPFEEGVRKDLVPSQSDWETALINNVEYSFVDNQNQANQTEITDIYTLEDVIINGKERQSIKILKYPSITDDIYLKVVLTIGESVITRYIQVYYINGDSSGGGGAGGDTYNYVYEELALLLPSKTYLTFTMPSTIKNIAVQYFIKSKNEDATESLLDRTADGMLVLNKIAGSTEFTIDLTKIPTNDTILEICYKFGNSIETYVRTSRLTIEGIIRKELFEDSKLFEAILQYKVGDEPIFNGKIVAEDGTVSYDGVISTVRAQSNINIVDLSNKSIINLEGIQHFRNIKKLILDGNVLDSNTVSKSLLRLAETNLESLSLKNSGLTANSLSQLGTLYALQELNLDSNELVSISELPSFGNLKILTASNNFITSIDSLIKFPSLSLLDVQNNKIKSFRKLYEIAALDKVYIYDNTVDDKFGTNGLCNQSIIALLAKKGIKVFQEVPNETLTNYFQYSNLSIDAKTAIGVIEGIKIYQGSVNSLQLPTKMYISANVVYNLNWDLTTLSNVVNGEISTAGIQNITFDMLNKDEVRVIFVSVSVGTATYFRHFEVVRL